MWDHGEQSLRGSKPRPHRRDGDVLSVGAHRAEHAVVGWWTVGTTSDLLTIAIAIAQTSSVPYNPGNPQTFAGQVATLKREFPDVFPDGNNVAQPGQGGANTGAPTAPTGA